MTPVEQQLRALIESVVREVLAETKAPAAPDHVTVADFARARAISETTVRAAIREKRLEHIRIGRAVRIPRDAQIGKAPRSPRDATARADLILLGGGKR